MMQQQHLLLDLAYLPPLAYFKLMMQYEVVWLEAEENFVKSTYRNRCYIASPNGELMMSVPVKGGKDHRQKYKETRIDYLSRDWQKIHWNSFVAGYQRSPYFEFYEDEFYEFYHAEHELLLDYNKALLDVLCRLLDMDIDLRLTTSYEKEPADKDDYRSVFKPNREFPKKLTIEPYGQVFEEKTGFLPHLSIVDLLFNLGPQAKGHLLTWK